MSSIRVGTMLRYISLALLASSIAASPVTVNHREIAHSRNAPRKRQLGEVPGLPAELASMVPVIAKMGLLPNMVKEFVNAGYGKVPAVTNAAPSRTLLPNANPHIPEAKSLKIRYGPYKVPSVSHKNMLGESGVLFNYPELDVEKPCEDDCILLGLNADLEYADGTNANTQNGMWLHHMVLFNVGPNRMDPTCVGKTSLPHLLIGSDPGKSERLMASGNERTKTKFYSPYNTQEKLGYFLNKEDSFSMILDFMNENKGERIVYLTMTYDFIIGKPPGYSNYRTIWLDVAQCGTSEVKPPKETGSFAISQDWVANLNGEIIGAGGHLHDGGTHLTLAVDGKQVCDSVASYSNSSSPGTLAGGMGGMASMRPAIVRRDGPGHGLSNMPHISAMSICAGKTMGVKQVEKGQKWTISGHYDYDKFPGMASNGHQSNVMGISVMMIKNWSI